MSLKHLFSPWAFKHQANIKTEGGSQCWSWESRACAEAGTAISLSAAGLPPVSRGREGVLSFRILQAPPDFPETGRDMQVPQGRAVRTGGSVQFPAQGCASLWAGSFAALALDVLQAVGEGKVGRG